MHYFVFILLQEFDYKYPRGTTPHILPPSYFSFLITSLLCIRQNTPRAAENNEWDRSDFRIKLTIISWVWGCLPIRAFISWEYANHACSCMWVDFVYASVLVCVRLYLRLFHVSAYDFNYACQLLAPIIVDEMSASGSVSDSTGDINRLFTGLWCLSLVSAQEKTNLFVTLYYILCWELELVLRIMS